MATKARLHWFWRGVIAALTGASLAILMAKTHIRGVTWVTQHVRSVLEEFVSSASDANLILMLIFFAVLPILATMATYGLLTWWLVASQTDGEIHCRRCNHILRGLSEPRCTECGEAI
jgi:hypothetical protein